MGAFAKYSVTDWLIMLQVVLIWFYMAFKAGTWFSSWLIRRCWRWWKRKDKRALAVCSFLDAIEADDLCPGDSLHITINNGLTIYVHRPAEVLR